MALSWVLIGNLKGPRGFPGDPLSPGALDAARAVAAAAILDADLIKGSDKRMQQATPDTSWRIRDRAGRVALLVDGNGNTTVGTTRIRPLPSATGWAAVWRDSTGQIALGIRGNGTVYAAGIDGAGGAAPTVHVFVGAGQSNMSGRGTPIGPDYDPVDSRIFQYGSKANSAGVITSGTVPLDMHDTSTGLSPLTTFAREYLKTQPPNTVVLLVPAAHGGTGFTTTAENPPPPGYTLVTGGAGCWQVNRADPVKLYDTARAQTQTAMTKAAGYFGSTPVLKGVLWHQGEADSSLTQAQYGIYLDEVVTAFRTDLGVTDLPFIVGEMSPDYTSATPATVNVQAAHKQTPARLERTAFAYGPPNTGKHGDIVHYSREGIQRLGKAMHGAYRRALGNTADSAPEPPATITATRTNGTLTITWEQALCRATGYVVEYRIDGGSWLTAPARAVALDTKATIASVTGGTIQARVSTINPNSTSAPTQAVTAIGA